MVDDPTTYGRIAAANALSDIYAVGGRPLTAMALAAFPPGMEQELVAVLNGGAEKVAEAGAVIVGGHTVEDEEPKYGLAVTGIVDPNRMLTTVGARPGDRLVLTKPIGTGVLTTALKGEVLTEADIASAISSMQHLNSAILELIPSVEIHACTDITGFGLLGHAAELAEASEINLAIDTTALPLYPRVREMIDLGLVPAGSHRNREFYRDRVAAADKVSPEQWDILTDPQTSGGLLLAVSPNDIDNLLTRLKNLGEPGWVIGEVDKKTSCETVRIL